MGLDFNFNIVKDNPRIALACTATIIVLFVGFTLLFSVVGGDGLLEVPPNNISSHVLDIANGKPAFAVNCTAYRWMKPESGDKNEDGMWVELAVTTTNGAGRIPLVHPGTNLSVGIYKLRFATKQYFEQQNQQTFYPYIEVIFEVDDIRKHYHVPITLSNFGYSTYKGQ
ncbi:HIUase/Transthyretin family domain-containing protein [Ditylenchus destructor]|uniref:hydroxyisourate hydrolase n=1 Tax=Ditylenchus destructor TaxID=166010 RepID=A0AAD4N5I1_9BILA|nr:HIUase/Transthyretin family domain-containing protein [Ditylenchus destructor]